MKIITEPHVHVLSVPHFFPHPEYLIPEHDNDAEKLIAHAGKGCYDSYGIEGRSVSDHINSLRSSSHGSVFEHANVSVFITGVSRGLSHELVRHRAGFAYSQRSTRYTSEETAAIVLDPDFAILHDRYKDFDDGVSTDNAISESAIYWNFISSCKHSFQHYKDEVRWLQESNPLKLSGTDLRKWARGKARQILPHALETRLTMTGNLRSWRTFLEQRSAFGAEEEIRRLAYHIYVQLAEVVPLVVSDYTQEFNSNSQYPQLTTQHWKI